jgi:hypothetical protein
VGFHFSTTCTAVTEYYRHGKKDHCWRIHPPLAPVPVVPTNAVIAQYTSSLFLKKASSLNDKKEGGGNALCTTLLFVHLLIIVDLPPTGYSSLRTKHSCRSGLRSRLTSPARGKLGKRLWWCGSIAVSVPLSS